MRCDFCSVALALPSSKNRIECNFGGSPWTCSVNALIDSNGCVFTADVGAVESGRSVNCASEPEVVTSQYVHNADTE